MIKSLKALFEPSSSTPETTDPICDSLEKAQKLLDTFQKRLEIESYIEGAGQRCALLRQQVGQAEKAAAFYNAEISRAQAAAVVVADQKTYESEREAATAAVKSAQSAVTLAEKNQAAIQARLAPLQIKLATEKQQAAAQLATAEAVFARAMSAGDEAGEAAASESLSRARKAASTEALSGSPTDLRVAALQNELTAAGLELEAALAKLAAEKFNLDSSNMRLLVLACDKKAAEFFDAIVEQRNFARIRNSSELAAIGSSFDFEIKVDKTARFAFRGFGINPREIKSDSLDHQIKHLASPIDFELLKMNVDDIALDVPELEANTTAE